MDLFFDVVMRPLATSLGSAYFAQKVLKLRDHKIENGVNYAATVSWA